jgi:hypothetical protein
MDVDGEGDGGVDDVKAMVAGVKSSGVSLLFSA